MRTPLPVIAQAIVDTCLKAGEQDYGPILDAAVTWLAQQGRAGDLRYLPREVERAWHKIRKSMSVQVTTPNGDLGSDQESILSALKTALHKSIDLTVSKDPSLIGGIVMAFEDERFDFSIKTALSRAGSQLSQPVSLL